MRVRVGLRAAGKRLRRATAVVYLAISSTVIMGFAAMAIDLGTLYSAQAELQRAADAAALAAASQLITGGTEPTDVVYDAALDVIDRNNVLHESLQATESNIELGRAQLDPVSGRFVFEAGGSVNDAVRVTLARAEGSGAGPVDLLFAKFLGHDNTSLQARASAVLVPRDIAVVIDLSNSMGWDSQLRFWDRTDGGYANLRDVWAALDGPEPSRPYLPGSELETEYAGDSGPTFGLMDNWGDPLLPGSYSPSSDPGLYELRRYQNGAPAKLTNSLVDRGYSSDEIAALTSGSRDGSSSSWRYRVCVLLGLAEWQSGMPGGKFDNTGTDGFVSYHGPGDGDTRIESGEMTAWASYPSWRGGGWTWYDYVGSTASVSDASEFNYRYGLKTFTNYLIEKYPEHYRNDNLWATPEEPLRAIKDAVQTMTDTIDDNDSLDHLSLEIFAQTSRHEVDLSGDLQNVPDRLYQMQCGHYDRLTSIAGGLSRAITELTSDRARPNAHKVIMLMSDGQANVDDNGNYYGDGHPAATGAAIDMAEMAEDLGFRIYTVSVGYYVDRDLMQQIAEIGRGEEFYAVGSPEEYTDQLEDIFRALGGKRPVALIE